MKSKLWLTPISFLGYAVALTDDTLFVLSDYKATHDAVKAAFEKDDLRSIHPVKISRVSLDEIAAIKDVETAARLYVFTTDGKKQNVELFDRTQVVEVRDALIKAVGKPVEVGEETMHRMHMVWGPLLVLAFTAMIFIPLTVAASSPDEVELTGRRHWWRLFFFAIIKVLGPFGIAAVGVFIFVAALLWLILRLRHPHAMMRYTFVS